MHTSGTYDDWLGGLPGPMAVAAVFYIGVFMRSAGLLEHLKTQDEEVARKEKRAENQFPNSKVQLLCGLAHRVKATRGERRPQGK
jgi:hypothetical protein